MHPSTKWTVTDLPGGLARIVNKASSLALEIPAGATADNTQLDQNLYSGAPYQQFQFLTSP